MSVSDSGVERISGRFAPGVSGNPGGKPVGSRNRLSGDFLRELSEDFARDGKPAIVIARETEPVKYLQIIASLMPKDVTISARPFTEFSDDDLLAAIDTINRFVARGGDSSGAGAAIEGEATLVVPALPEAAGVPRGGEDASGAPADGGEPSGEDVERGR